MDWIMKAEEGFFPKLAGELGSSLSDVKQQQKRLEDFKPTIVVSTRCCRSLIYTLLSKTMKKVYLVCMIDLYTYCYSVDVKG